jgi:NADH:ubiquinone oxidoreductase subunit K
MAGFFAQIPIISVILFGIGLVGVMVYERSRTRQSKEPESSTS